jgi:hypothetical protein
MAVPHKISGEQFKYHGESLPDFSAGRTRPLLDQTRRAGNARNNSLVLCHHRVQQLIVRCPLAQQRPQHHVFANVADVQGIEHQLDL